MKSKYLYRRLSSAEEANQEIRPIIGHREIDDIGIRIQRHIYYGNKRFTNVLSFTDSLEYAQSEKKNKGYDLPTYVAVINSFLLDDSKFIDISTRDLYLKTIGVQLTPSYTINDCLKKFTNYDKDKFSENSKEYCYLETVPFNSYIIVERSLLKLIYRYTEIPTNYIHNLYKYRNSPAKREFQSVLGWDYILDQGSMRKWEKTVSIILCEYAYGSYTNMAEVIEKYGVVLPREIFEISEEFSKLFSVIDEDDFISSRKKCREEMIDRLWSGCHSNGNEGNLNFEEALRTMPWVNKLYNDINQTF